MQQSVRQSSQSISRYRYLDAASVVRRAEPAAGVAIELAGLYLLIALLWGYVIFIAVSSSFR